MRKLLFTLAFIATLTTSVPTMAQKHRHTPRTQELVDTTSSAATAIEAYSDTTATATDTTISYNNNGSKALFASFDYDGEDEEFGAKFTITICFIVFVLAPISIIGLIFYFIRQSRKDKIRLAELAAQNGQPIPTDLLRSAKNSNANYAPGVRQCCLGIGLAIFLGIIMDELGFGIGALVFFIGLGKIISVYLTKDKLLPNSPETNASTIDPARDNNDSQHQNL